LAPRMSVASRYHLCDFMTGHLNCAPVVQSIGDAVQRFATCHIRCQPHHGLLHQPRVNPTTRLTRACRGERNWIAVLRSHAVRSRAPDAKALRHPDVGEAAGAAWLRAAIVPAIDVAAIVSSAPKINADGSPAARRCR
jgi:hypothetical protein